MTNPRNDPRHPPLDLTNGIHEAYDRAIEKLTARQSPAGLIYHYCDANALLSILQNRTVWATDTAYLNDADELASVFRNIESHLQAVDGTYTRYLYDRFKEVAKAGAGFRKTLIGMSAYVACFSEDGDVLSQWRAYAANGMGFAIGFDPTKLRVLAKGGGGTLKRMIYGGSKEEEIVLDYFSDVAAALAPHTASLDKLQFPSTRFDLWVQLRISEFLYEFSFECKHPAFHEEREWRIMAGKGPVLFRAGNNRLIPYRLLDMTSVDSETLMPIKEIVIGPCAHSMESERALTYIAESLGYGHGGIRFRKSTAPFRR